MLMIKWKCDNIGFEYMKLKTLVIVVLYVEIVNGVTLTNVIST